MNRTADQIIDAMALCCVDGGASGFIIGDNEMARLVQEYRGMKEALHSSDCAVHNAPALPVGPCDCK